MHPVFHVWILAMVTFYLCFGAFDFISMILSFFHLWLEKVELGHC